MAGIFPLHGVRYPGAKQSELVAPPYDVLSGADKAKMLARNPHNIVAIDLPHIPPKEAGPDAAYAAAADLAGTVARQRRAQTRREIGRSTPIGRPTRTPARPTSAAASSHGSSWRNSAPPAQFTRMSKPFPGPRKTA